MFFLYFSLFHIYFFCFPFGFSYLALLSTALHLLHAMMFFWNAYEIPAYEAGVITAMTPRVAAVDPALTVYQFQAMVPNSGAPNARNSNSSRVSRGGEGGGRRTNNDSVVIASSQATTVSAFTFPDEAFLQQASQSQANVGHRQVTGQGSTNSSALGHLSPPRASRSRSTSSGASSISSSGSGSGSGGTYNGGKKADQNQNTSVRHPGTHPGDSSHSSSGSSVPARHATQGASELVGRVVPGPVWSPPRSIRDRHRGAPVSTSSSSSSSSATSVESCSR